MGYRGNIGSHRTTDSWCYDLIGSDGIDESGSSSDELRNRLWLYKHQGPSDFELDSIQVDLGLKLFQAEAEGMTIGPNTLELLDYVDDLHDDDLRARHMGEAA